MRSSPVVSASDCQCRSCNSPGFDLSILRHSGIWEAADEAVLNKAYRKKIQKTPLVKKCGNFHRLELSLCPPNRSPGCLQQRLPTSCLQIRAIGFELYVHLFLTGLMYIISSILDAHYIFTNKSTAFYKESEPRTPIQTLLKINRSWAQWLTLIRMTKDEKVLAIFKGLLL